MLCRHEHSLFNAYTPSIGYKPRGPRDPSPFTLQDLQILSHFATKKNGSDSQHGRLLTARSLDDQEELSRVREWSTCSDGALMVGDQALRTLRPQHYHQYLLKEDRFGVLCPARNRAKTGFQKTSKRSGESISLLRAKVLRMNADQPLSPDLLQGRYSQRSVVSATCDSSLSIVKPKPFGKRTGSEEASRLTTSLGCSSDADDGRQLDGPAEAASSQALASNSNGTRRPTTKPIAVTPSDRSQVEEGYDEAGSRPAPPDSRARRDCTLEDDHSSTDRNAFQFSQQTGDHSLPRAALGTLMDQSDLCEVVLPNFGHTATKQCTDQDCADELRTSVETDQSMTERQSTTSGTPSGNTAFTSLGPSIHNTVDEIVFLPGTCHTERLKLQHWADIAHETENQALHLILKHWLHPVQYASIHAVVDTEEVVDTDTTVYDVLAIPWDVFKSQAGKGEVFRTLLLIKETFANADEFSVKDYADRLKQTFVGIELIVRYHISTPELLLVSEAARLVQTLHNTILPDAPNFLNLESSSNAIKLGLTCLPRYRLLDTLVRGAKANYAGRLGKKIYLTPFNVGSC